MKKSKYILALLFVLLLTSPIFAQERETLQVVPSPSYTHCPNNNHPHLIDLGFYSGTKWACCNVGATTPEGHGGFFAWGETEEKTEYNDVNYKFCKGMDYNNDGWYDKNFHSVVWDYPGSEISGTDYDVARIKWGWRGNWQMPTMGQLNELFNYCTSQWTTYNGIYGWLFTSKKNGGTIFFPASGFRRGQENGGVGAECYYSSGTLYSYLYLNQEVHRNVVLRQDHLHQYYGCSVRPAMKTASVMDLKLSSTFPINMNPGNDYEIPILSGNGSFTVKSSASEVVSAKFIDGSIVIHANTVGTSLVTVVDNVTGQTAKLEVNVNHLLPSYTSCPDNNHPHLIDLGLKSGTKWACCNVDADSPDDYGGYYAWGETEEFDETETKSSSLDYGSNICGTGFDVASVKWGIFWQIPSREQFEEMYKSCKREWITRPDDMFRGGVKFTGPSGGSIYLPSAGMRPVQDYTTNEDYGYYWSGNRSSFAIDTKCNISHEYSHSSNYLHHYCFSVRPVAKKIIISEPVDLGLSVKWASWNIGAETPEEIGDMYGWGELYHKDENSMLPYRFYDGKYTKYGNIDNKYRLDLEDDVAHQLWGGKWRMPTYEELKEMKEKCQFKSVKKNNVLGVMVIGPNGNEIFFPCPLSSFSTLQFNTQKGDYWSSELEDDSFAFAYHTYWYSDKKLNPHTWEMIALYYSERREIGLAIRPVFGEITDEDNDDNTDVKSVYQTAPYPVIYNLNGQRRNTLEKGINIVNGKKVLVR